MIWPHFWTRPSVVARDFSGVADRRLSSGRGQSPTAGRPGRLGRCAADLGSQPGPGHRPTDGQRPADPRRAAGRPGAVKAAQLLNQVKPTLPVLLANLTTVSRIAVTYHARWSNCRCCCPVCPGSVQAVGLPRNPTGFTQGDFTDHRRPAGLHGRLLPSSSWRSPSDLTDVDTPDGLYCKLPQDSR